MAHAKFTKETVFEAAEKLLSSGESPTITRIREEIGGGSPNDITAWMKEWRNQQQKLSDAQKVPAPGNIRDQANLFLSEFVTTVWDTARIEAGNKLKAERQALSDAQAELEHETSEALEMAETLNAENLALKNRIQELEAAGIESRKQIGALQTQTERDQKAIGDISKEKERLTKELLEARIDAKQANTLAAELSGELTELRRASTETKAELNALKTQSESIKRERDIALIEKESAQKEFEDNKLELKSLQKESISLNAQVDKHQIALDTAVRKIDELQSEIKEARAKQSVAELESAGLKGELKALATLKTGEAK